MNIIAPLGGKRERFNKPKSLIKIFDKFMIYYLIDNYVYVLLTFLK